MTRISLSPKVEALYQAVDELMLEGADVNRMTVAQITERAGIGKGTAYEYFTNKEELIAGALIHKISIICIDLQVALEKKSNFREKILYILDVMDEKKYEQACLLKVVNVVTDNSPISHQIEKRVKEQSQEMYMPEKILEHLLQCAGDEGWQQRAIPVSYTRLNIASKLLTYGMYALTPRSERDCEPALMHRLVCDGICSEVGID